MDYNSGKQTAPSSSTLERLKEVAQSCGGKLVNLTDVAAKDLPDGGGE